MAAEAFSNFLHLQRAQRHAPARLARAQFALIERLVATASREVPLYHELYADAVTHLRTWDDFRRLPLVTKSHVKAAFPDRITNQRFSPGDLYPIATSGTTDRVMLFHDERKRDWDRAADLLLSLEFDRFRPAQRSAIIPPDVCLERCGADAHGHSETVFTKLKKLLEAPAGRRKSALREVLAQVMRDYIRRCRVLKSFAADGTSVSASTLERYVRELRSYRPFVLSGAPVDLLVLARHLESRPGMHLAQIVRPSGGKMTPGMAAIVQRALGGRFRENYGTAELGTVGFDCECGRWQHLLSPIFHLEVLRKGEPVAAGEVGELVITDLRNEVAPLIRYRIGDVGRYTLEPCACGRTGLRFCVDGRLTETIVTPQGRVVTGDRLIDHFLAYPQVHHVRVMQKDDARFMVEMVAAPDATLPDAPTLSRGLSDLLEHDVTVQPRRVVRLMPERTGKYQLVVSVSHARLHDEIKQDTHDSDRARKQTLAVS